MGDPKRMKPQDPLFYGLFIGYLIILLILLMSDFTIFGIDPVRIWLGLGLVVVTLSIILVLFGIVLYQTKIHFPNVFYKLPKWIRKWL